MWKSEHEYIVTKEERQLFNPKIHEAYGKRGVTFEVDMTVPEPFVCYMNHSHRDNKYSFAVGTCWLQEENIIPIISMSHELGHYLDVRDNYDSNIKLYHKTLGTRELEARAWFYAVDVAKEIGFTRWDVFFKYAKTCLATYFESNLDFMDWRHGFEGENPTLENALMRLQDRIGSDFQLDSNLTLATPKEISYHFEKRAVQTMRERRAEARQGIKKQLGAKSWEL